MTDEELKEKVIRHDYEIKALTESLSNLSENMRELTTSIKHIAVINEKLFNMDKDLKESFQRVHARTDELEKYIEDGFKELEVFRFVAKYPKVALFAVAGFCVLNIEPIRKIIFGG